MATGKDWSNACMAPSDHCVSVLVGKYVSLPDAYLSIVEALNHAGFERGVKIDLDWIHAEDVEGLLVASPLKDLDGVIIAPGFGERGVEGKIRAANYTRENNIPCLGICLGLQVMVVEFARNELGLPMANSSEFDTGNKPTPDPVIHLMDEQRNVTDMGGTMRLGAYVAELVPRSQVATLYDKTVVSERHRHRYEVNPAYRGRFEEHGLHCSGQSPDGKLVEFIEIARAPVLGRHPGASRIQEPSQPAGATVPGAGRSGTRAQPGSQPAAHQHRRANDGSLRAELVEHLTREVEYR